jgi:hypothetical protein
MGWLRKRMGEGSSAAGLGLLIMALEAYQSGGTKAAIAAAVSGLAAICLPEKA